MLNQTAENQPPIIGAWALVTFQLRKDTGEVIYPFGPDARGRIIYTASGHYSAQLMRTTRPRFADPDQMKGTAEEIKAGFEGCISYFGQYEFHAADGFIVHQVDGSLFPNWEGQAMKRFYVLAGDRLRLSTPPMVWGGGGEVVSRLEWQRLA